MIWFIIRYGGAVFALWFLWGLRNRIRRPWAEYVSHYKMTDGTVFLKVKHWSAWPPWLQYEETWYRKSSSHIWHREKSGEFDANDKALEAIFNAAESRQRQTDEVINDEFFKIGDVVKLKSGSPVGTVSSVTEHGVKITWHNPERMFGGTTTSDRVPAACLERATVPK